MDGRRLTRIGSIHVVEADVPSTTVHLSENLVEQLDRVARSRGVSRNRVVVEACERLVAAERGEWPAGFFDRRLDEADRAALHAAGQELEDAVVQGRRDRPVPPL